ncbi:MAG: hypothetical protein NZ455_01650 [Bacteroidia bacterium]|nr:hypothetical protein [Bacteroidia bacterium]MDW8346729.1 hypothetical protein [Bacteroidia bacterium]
MRSSFLYPNFCSLACPFAATRVRQKIDSKPNFYITLHKIPNAN